MAVATQPCAEYLYEGYDLSTYTLASESDSDRDSLAQTLHSSLEDADFNQWFFDKKVNPDQWRGLEPIEAFTINAYTQNLFLVLNRNLRKSETEAITPEVANAIKAVASGLNKIKPFRGTVWRGVSLGPAALGIDPNNFDQIYAERSFLSTSANRARVEQIWVSKANWTDYTLFKINSLSGRAIAGMTNSPSENEVLFVPGTEFRVKSVYKNPGIGPRVTVVEMDEINPPDLSHWSLWSNVKSFADFCFKAVCSATSDEGAAKAILSVEKADAVATAESSNGADAMPADAPAAAPDDASANNRPGDGSGSSHGDASHGR